MTLSDARQTPRVTSLRPMAGRAKSGRPADAGEVAWKPGECPGERL